MWFLRGIDFSHGQKTGETIDQYVTNLRNRSKTCQFGVLTDSLIKDRLVCRIPDDSLKRGCWGSTIWTWKEQEHCVQQPWELLGESWMYGLRWERMDAEQSLWGEEGNQTSEQRQTRKDVVRCGMRHPPQQIPSMWQNRQQLQQKQPMCLVM